MTVLRVFTAALAIAVLATSASMAGAQSWPTRPVTVVSPFTAGNASDLIGRITLEQVAKQVGQPFVIENRPGAGGTVGVNQVAKADPDGHTILMHSSSFSAALVLHKSLPYDTLQDFAPVIPIGIQPVVLIVSPSKGFKTVGDLVAAAKANPGAMNFASAGIARPRTWARSGSATRRVLRRSTFRSAVRRRRSPKS
jgi:tripartite-type tricarboxylate transporter receptor subunit TctC